MNVRKATGRRVEGGSRIGRTEVRADSGLGLFFRKGCTGVPNAGDEEGIGSESMVGVFLPRGGSWEVGGGILGVGEM